MPSPVEPYVKVCLMDLNSFSLCPGFSIFFLYFNLKQKPLLLSIPHNKLPCLKPSDVDVIELHDCFSANELINYEALGLCPLGKAGEMIDNGDNTYGGKYVVNPSGGLISKVDSNALSFYNLKSNSKSILILI